MREIEVKILGVHIPTLVKKLERFGAQKTFAGKMIAQVFDFSDHRIRKGGGQLRVRSRGEIVELTFKKGLKHAKVKMAEEHEVLLKDGKTLQKILEGIGLERKRKVVKRRLAYSLGKVHFDIDTYSSIPPFLEIEAPSVRIVQAWVEKLGYSMKDAKNWTGKQVMEYYRKKKAGKS